MSEPSIPDRSAEPALQESLDHGVKSRTPVHTEDAERDARAAQEKQQPPDPAEVEELTGVPEESEELSQL
jgi:hypothetical protein